jgi:hypothetical protein
MLRAFETCAGGVSPVLVMAQRCPLRRFQLWNKYLTHLAIIPMGQCIFMSTIIPSVADQDSLTPYPDPAF